MSEVLPPPFVFAIAVQPTNIDFMGHVNNAVYLQWVQEAVLDHWRSRAPAVTVAAFRWVALRHLITYHRPAFLGDPLRAVLTLRSVRGAKAFYDAAIRRDEDLVAHIESTWCCLDASSLRPTRLGRDITRCFAQGGF